MNDGLGIRRARLDDPQIVALVALHRREAHANSPIAGMFALDLSGLADPAVTLFGAWAGDELAGMGALRALTPDHGELKSMRTAPSHQRRGVAAAMLAHLLGEARTRGYRRVSLETGANDAFAPARSLYESRGFVSSGPFGDYVLTEFNRCYTLAL